MSRIDDARIAEILGWTRIMGAQESMPYGGRYDLGWRGLPPNTHPGYPDAHEIPEFTTDPAADYMVLDFLRDKWLFSGDDRLADLFDEWESELNTFLSRNDKEHRVYFSGSASAYKPGFYSRALLALKDKGII